MNQKEKLLKQVLAEFDVLVQEHGFAQPAISREEWMTRVDYLHKDIGIEIELDWRDFDIFTLIVRLENGNLPSGYYVANGKKCRKHLANICKEQRWPNPSSKFDQSTKRTESDFQHAIELSKMMTTLNILRLLEKGESLFSY
jgi:hypothetical protein